MYNKLSSIAKFKRDPDKKKMETERIHTKHLGLSGVLTYIGHISQCAAASKSYFAVKISQGYGMHMI